MILLFMSLYYLFERSGRHFFIENHLIISLTSVDYGAKSFSWYYSDCKLKIYYYYFLRFYLFIFRQRGRREKERERNINVWLPPMCPALGNPACNPGMCPCLASNQRPFDLQAGTQPTSPHQLGCKLKI